MLTKASRRLEAMKLVASRSYYHLLVREAVPMLV